MTRQEVCLTLVHRVARVGPAAHVRGHQRRFQAVLAAVPAAALIAFAPTPARGHAPVLGIAFGLAIPGDRLTGHADARGAALLPAPVVTARCSGAPAGGGRGIAWTAEAGAARFRSNEREGLYALYLPVQAGAAWHAATLDRLALRAAVLGGPAFISVNQGSERSSLAWGATAGWQAASVMRDMTVAIEAAVSLLWSADLREVFTIRLVLLTG